MPTVQADRLTRIGAALLRAAGATEEEASAVATGCVNANLAGHDSHGIIAIPTREQQRKVSGIEVEGTTWDRLRALATEYGLASELDLA